MAVLQPSEYDMSYFDGREGALKHNAGYAGYERWHRNDGADSLGEYWLDKAKFYVDKYQLQGKKVLDIGCAKGFMVEDLRGMGVDAYGLDVSPYAIGEAETAVQPYLHTGDARTYLTNFARGEFDIVFSLRVLGCLPEADIPDLIDEINRITKFQFHVIDETPNPDYYIAQPLSWWAGLNFPKNTVLIGRESKEEVAV